MSLGAGRRALSKREHEVLTLLADGLSLREVGAELVLGLRPSGRTSIYDKLGARTRAHAVGIAFRGGLLDA
jgi:DNA-binding CsgD family transcriptional regulator